MLLELLPSSCLTSDVPRIFDCNNSNNRQINTSKTKEVIFVSRGGVNLPVLSTSAVSVERVSTFELLGRLLRVDLIKWVSNVRPSVHKKFL